MSDCTRFEDEGLAALERGEELDDHFKTCEDCVEAQHKYNRLKTLLTESRSADSPAEGWENEVLAAIRESENDEPSYGISKWYGSIAASIAVIGIVTMLFWQTGAPPPGSSLQVSLVAGESVYRGSNGKIGDRLEVTVQAGDAAHKLIRVYRDDRLFSACAPSQTNCVIAEDLSSATVVISAIGEYRVLLLQSDQQVQGFTGQLDADVQLARTLGAKVEISDVITVLLNTNLDSQAWLHIPDRGHHPRHCSRES